MKRLDDKDIKFLEKYFKVQHHDKILKSYFAKLDIISILLTIKKQKNLDINLG